MSPIRSSSRMMAICAVILLTIAAVLETWSKYLWNWAWSSSHGIYVVVALGIVAGAVYLVAVGSVWQSNITRSGLSWIIVIGLLMRLMLLQCAPEKNSDSFRYMWDGALTAHGLSPYRHTPQDGKCALTDAHANPQLQAVAREAGPHLEWINHPQVRTIYPPVAQAAFVAAHWLKPWNGTAWRVVLLAFDIVTLGLLLVLLRQLRLPQALVAIYWWNPLVVSEFYCAGHLDAIVLPFVLGALLLALRGQITFSMLCLAGAVAAKFWPVILLPLLLRPALRDPRRSAIAVGTFVLATGVLLLPMFMAGSSGTAGIETYARSWESNDGLFQLNVFLWRHTLSLLALPAWAVQPVARATTVFLFATWVLFLARKPLSDPVELCEACLLVIAGLFLLSPTQFPWYYTWMVPLLALRPRWSLLAYTALLPLYYLYHRHGPWVWVEHVPVWALLIRECALRSRYSEPVHPGEPTLHESAIVATSNY